MSDGKRAELRAIERLITWEFNIFYDGNYTLDELRERCIDLARSAYNVGLIGDAEDELEGEGR